MGEEFDVMLYDQHRAPRVAEWRHPPTLVRQFDSGATRNPDENQLDYEGFLSPIALKRFAEYMHKHRRQADGSLRASDNWQKGIPLDSYVKSLVRHTMDVWLEHRGGESREGIEDGLCGVLFNGMGMLLETLKKKEAA
jgi:hypothetical protein